MPRDRTSTRPASLSRSGASQSLASRPRISRSDASRPGLGRRTKLRALLFIALLAPHLWVPEAAARPATCFTTDDGRYACDFQQFGGDGSFIVRAPGIPTFTMSMEGRGVASGFADFGGGNITLPGPFYRSNQDRACWVSDATGFSICVY